MSYAFTSASQYVDIWWNQRNGVPRRLDCGHLAAAGRYVYLNAKTGHSKCDVECAGRKFLTD